MREKRPEVGPPSSGSDHSGNVCGDGARANPQRGYHKYKKTCNNTTIQTYIIIIDLLMVGVFI